MSVPSSYTDKLISRIKSSGLTLSDKVIEAFEYIPREYFVLEKDKNLAYRDTPLPIPAGQTISAPHMYAMMLSKELTDPQPGMRAMEIGTGSGYGAALLAYAVQPGKVITLERHAQLIEFAKQNINKLDLDNIEIIQADGTVGREGDKFDRILVTAAGPKVPRALVNQLKPDGVLVIPIEENFTQWLTRVTLDEDLNPKLDKQFQVRFVPLIGKEGFEK